jgi:hypothetical protein
MHRPRQTKNICVHKNVGKPEYNNKYNKTCIHNASNSEIQGDPKVTQPINPLLEKISPLC